MAALPPSTSIQLSTATSFTTAFTSPISVSSASSPSAPGARPTQSAVSNSNSTSNSASTSKPFFHGDWIPVATTVLFIYCFGSLLLLLWLWCRNLINGRLGPRNPHAYQSYPRNTYRRNRWIREWASQAPRVEPHWPRSYMGLRWQPNDWRRIDEMGEAEPRTPDQRIRAELARMGLL